MKIHDDQDWVQRRRGWFAVLPCKDAHFPLPARGPWRSNTEIHGAIHRYLLRVSSSFSLAALRSCREAEVSVLGPYPTRAAARAARPSDPVGRVPLTQELDLG